MSRFQAVFGDRKPIIAMVHLGASPGAPHLGEHTQAVLRELGRSDAQIQALCGSGAAPSGSGPAA